MSAPPAAKNHYENLKPYKLASLWPPYSLLCQAAHCGPAGRGPGPAPIGAYGTWATGSPLYRTNAAGGGTKARPPCCSIPRTYAAYLRCILTLRTNTHTHTHTHTHTYTYVGRHVPPASRQRPSHSRQTYTSPDTYTHTHICTTTYSCTRTPTNSNIQPLTTHTQKHTTPSSIPNVTIYGPLWPLSLHHFIRTLP